MKAAAENKTGKSYSVPSLPDGAQLELLLELHSPLCENCRTHSRQWGSKWCDLCMWNLIKDDQYHVSYN